MEWPMHFNSSETGGLGVKMVEYVLGTSPTTPKDLEPRMVNLRLVSNDKKISLVPLRTYVYVSVVPSFCFYSFYVQNTDADKKEKDKGSASPFDNTKDDTGPQGNGLASQNGLDDDKGFK